MKKGILLKRVKAYLGETLPYFPIAYTFCPFFFPNDSWCDRFLFNDISKRLYRYANETIFGAKKDDSRQNAAKRFALRILDKAIQNGELLDGYHLDELNKIAPYNLLFAFRYFLAAFKNADRPYAKTLAAIGCRIFDNTDIALDAQNALKMENMHIAEAFADLGVWLSGPHETQPPMTGLWDRAKAFPFLLAAAARIAHFGLKNNFFSWLEVPGDADVAAQIFRLAQEEKDMERRTFLYFLAVIAYAKTGDIRRSYAVFSKAEKEGIGYSFLHHRKGVIFECAKRLKTDRIAAALFMMLTDKNEVDYSHTETPLFSIMNHRHFGDEDFLYKTFMKDIINHFGEDVFRKYIATFVTQEIRKERESLIEQLAERLRSGPEDTAYVLPTQTEPTSEKNESELIHYSKEFSSLRNVLQKLHKDPHRIDDILKHAEIEKRFAHILLKLYRGDREKIYIPAIVFPDQRCYLPLNTGIGAIRYMEKVYHKVPYAPVAGKKLKVSESVASVKENVLNASTMPEVLLRESVSVALKEIFKKETNGKFDDIPTVLILTCSILRQSGKTYLMLVEAGRPFEGIETLPEYRKRFNVLGNSLSLS